MVVERVADDASDLHESGLESADFHGLAVPGVREPTAGLFDFLDADLRDGLDDGADSPGLREDADLRDDRDGLGGLALPVLAALGVLVHAGQADVRSEATPAAGDGPGVA
ncbi:hypothetical protein ACFU1R_29820, partial [Priestia megaterium]|uniref:hypothetical protein n=1 Tax=Priestia megaterium TaxID=1404 RepID=UPI003672A2AD